MGDIKSVGLLYFKAALFILLGCLSGGCLIAQNPNLETAVLLAITIWSFCRCYYFVFYVIEHYVDSRYRFSGLWSFFLYLRNKPPPPS